MRIDALFLIVSCKIHPLVNNIITSFQKNRIKHITSNSFQSFLSDNHESLKYMYVDGLLKGLHLKNTNKDHWPLKITETVTVQLFHYLGSHQGFSQRKQVSFWCLILGGALNISNVYYLIMLHLEFRTQSQLNLDSKSQARRNIR